MNFTNETSSAHPSACFAEVSTYGELKALLPGTGTGRVPGLKKLKEAASIVLRSKTDCGGIIEVYDNGYYTYMEDACITVYAVDRCSVLEWYSCTGETLSSKGEDLSALPWTMPLEIAGFNRLDHNNSNRQESKYEYSLNASASENNILFSVRPEHELKDAAEEEKEFRRMRSLRIAETFASLSHEHKELIRVFFIENHTQDESAALLGINQSTVSRRLVTIKRLFEKFL